MRSFLLCCPILAVVIQPAQAQFADFRASRVVYADASQDGTFRKREPPDVAPLTYEAIASFAPAPGNGLPISARAFHESSFSASQIIARGGTSDVISYGRTQRDVATGESFVWSSFRVTEPALVHVSMTVTDPGGSRVFDERGELIVPESDFGLSLGMAWAVLSKPDCQLHEGQWGAADDCALLALNYRSANVVDGDPARVPADVRARIERDMVFPLISAAEVRQPRIVDEIVMLTPGEYMLFAQAIDVGSLLARDFPTSFDVTLTAMVIPEPSTWLLAAIGLGLLAGYILRKETL